MVPDLYYKFSKDFNYRQYLEDKSHFDQLGLVIDERTQSIVGTSNQIQSAITNGINEVSTGLSEVNAGLSQIASNIDHQTDVINQGFTRLEIGLDEVSSSIDDLRAVTEIGLSELVHTGRITNDLLEQLVTVVSTPEQTWAKEQFDLAKQCRDNELWPEAFEYIEKAITGADGRAGLKVEPTFYFFRGTLFLGVYKGGYEFLDIVKAFDDFSACARYCAKNNDRIKGEALRYAGWCKYLQGDVKEAIKLLHESLSLNQDVAETHFLLAKMYCHKNDTSQAKKFFQDAIDRSPLYFNRSLRDKDFSTHRDLIYGWAEEVRSLLQQQLIKQIETHYQPNVHKKLLKLGESHKINIESLRQFGDRLDDDLRSLKKDKPIIEIKKFAVQISAPVNSLIESRNSVLDDLDKLADRLKAAKPNTVIPTKKVSDVTKVNSDTIFGGTSIFSILGIVVGVIFAVNEGYSSCVGAEDCGPVGWVLLFPLISIMAAIITVPVGFVGGIAVGFIGTLIIKLFSDLGTADKLKKERQEAKENLTQEIANVEVDKGKGATLAEEVAGLRRLFDSGILVADT